MATRLTSSLNNSADSQNRPADITEANSSRQIEDFRENPSSSGPPSDGATLDCKISVLTHYLPPYIAGVFQHLNQSVRDLEIFLSIDQEPNRNFGNTWKGLSVHVQNSWMIRRPWKHSTGFTDELFVHIPYDTYSRLRRANPDIVFSFELGFRSLVSAIYCRLHRKPLVLCVCVSEHTEQGRGRLRHFLRKRLLSFARAVTFNGPSCRRYLEDYGVPDERLYHFPYAASERLQYQGPIERPDASARRLVCVGQLTERKGVDRMVDTIAHYCRSNPTRQVELDLVGTGPLEQQLRSTMLPDNFALNFLGHMPYEKLSQLFENCGISIFPTMADEWGLVVNEAMKAGMPVLGSTYAQASTTLIEEGENGWLYCPDDPDQLEQKLDAMFETPIIRLNQMRIQAQRTVANITAPNVAAKAMTLFRDVLSSSHR